MNQVFFNHVKSRKLSTLPKILKLTNIVFVVHIFYILETCFFVNIYEQEVFNFKK